MHTQRYFVFPRITLKTQGHNNTGKYYYHVLLFITIFCNSRSCTHASMEAALEEAKASLSDDLFQWYILFEDVCGRETNVISFASDGALSSNVAQSPPPPSPEIVFDCSSLEREVRVLKDRLIRVRSLLALQFNEPFNFCNSISSFEDRPVCQTKFLFVQTLSCSLLFVCQSCSTPHFLPFRHIPGRQDK
jgi:hypothetical protein